MNHVHLSPNQDPHVGIICFWSITLHLSPPRAVVRPTSLLRRQKKAVNSAILTVPQAQHPTYRTSHAVAPAPHHDQAVPTHADKEPSVATLSRKPSSGKPQRLCFSESHLGTDQWLFLQMLPRDASWSLFSCASSRRLVAQDETSNRHQRWSDYLTRKGEC